MTVSNWRWTFTLISFFDITYPSPRRSYPYYWSHKCECHWGIARRSASAQKWCWGFSLGLCTSCRRTQPPMYRYHPIPLLMLVIFSKLSSPMQWQVASLLFVVLQLQTSSCSQGECKMVLVRDLDVREKRERRQEKRNLSIKEILNHMLLMGG